MQLDGETGQDAHVQHALLALEAGERLLEESHERLVDARDVHGSARPQAEADRGSTKELAVAEPARHVGRPAERVLGVGRLTRSRQRVTGLDEELAVLRAPGIGRTDEVLGLPQMRPGRGEVAQLDRSPRAARSAYPTAVRTSRAGAPAARLAPNQWSARSLTRSP